METRSTFSDYGARLREFISKHSLGDATARPHSATEPSAEFGELARALFALQFDQVTTYRRLCEARRVTPRNVGTWTDIPAMPTAAFKEYEVSSLLAQDRTAVFYSSGTTVHRPSRHFHNRESLKLYEASLLPWFQRHILPEAEDRMLILTPSPALAPNSSLVYMFQTVRREFAPEDSVFAGTSDANGSWKLNGDQAWQSLARAVAENRRVILLGTAFSFVELLDWMTERNLRVSLPAGSRALETGGYKGRSRALPKHELHRLITNRLGIPSTHIVCEYGMSELSSQAYDRVAGPTAFQISNLKFEIEERLLRFPPWARAQIVSSETGQEVGEGETGLIRVFDLANVRSVMAIQTEDLGVRHGNGFALVGRSPHAEPRGCSLHFS